MLVVGGLVGILLQGDKEGELYYLFVFSYIYCVSKITIEPEQKYHTSKLELMAIIWIPSRLRPYLFHTPFTVYTDCQALIYIYMHSNKNLRPQIAR